MTIWRNKFRAVFIPISYIDLTLFKMFSWYTLKILLDLNNFPKQHRNNLRGFEYTHYVMTKGILYLRMVFNVRFPC